MYQHFAVIFLSFVFAHLQFLFMKDSTENHIKQNGVDYEALQWMIIVLPWVVNGTGLNGGTTEQSSFEFCSSLTDSCVNQENKAITKGL